MREREREQGVGVGRDKSATNQYEREMLLELNKWNGMKVAFTNMGSGCAFFTRGSCELSACLHISHHMFKLIAQAGARGITN